MTAGIDHILRKLAPHFDASRLIIKVVSTWEGLQACKQLKSGGIKTIATTLFTFEQAALAAEAGCYYIAPFLHELKAFFDEKSVRVVFERIKAKKCISYKDNDPCFDLCVRIQRYYEQVSSATKVKVAGLLTADQAIRLAGAHTMTIAPAVLRELSEARGVESELTKQSLFANQANAGQKQAVPDFLDDETRWKQAFAKSSAGKGEWKTAQVSSGLSLSNFDLLTVVLGN